MENTPETYRLPLRVSLTRPILMGGVPRAFAILNATIGAAIGLGLQQPFIGLPLWAALQAGAAWAATRDPWFLETWPRHLAKPKYFSV
ncbi:VirB3 family type IV secretion system protein [Terricaulis silvestris]|uniref:Type IV secretory pathway, VirB3-like protein n=1 Tax=Terricaulis silvestris TaxID=2686094 RepID=A0A6I6MUV9_9CAUL|nr:VirB3 family type IV secretion system protein [Terricaulis silvestris]QGZ94953.1 Type IV secretory pathway, VirB3-like protein [Terricaulis silvestris]